MLKNKFLYFISLALLCGHVSASKQISLPVGCITNCFTYDEQVIVDGASGTAYSSSNPIPVTTSGTVSDVNVTKFGGTNVSTGTGTGGAGIPRVTVSSDSSVTANAGTNLNTTTLGTTIIGAGSKTLTDINTTLGSPLQAGGNVVVTSAPTTAVTQSGTWTVQPGNTANTTAWKVDGSAVTQPISAASLPLPALAATSTKQSDGTQKTQIVDGSGNVIGATSNALDINIKSGNPTTIAATQSGTWTTQPGNTANTTPWLNTPTPVVSPLSSSSPGNITSSAYEASHVVKASAGVLYSIACYNSKASAQFVLVFNSTTVPADAAVANAVPLYCPATSNCALDYGQYGKYFSTGISWSNSSTSPTKTIGSADVFCDARNQ